MVKIILVGALGAMGRVVTDLFTQNIVAGVDLQPAKLTHPFMITKTLEDLPEQFVEQADCILDFSHFSQFPRVIEFAYNNNLPVVVATTGLSQQDINSAQYYAKKIPIFISSNMSLGIAAVIQALKPLTKLLGNKADIDIIEKHHRLKQDAPSGTALMIADAIGENLDAYPTYVMDRTTGKKRRRDNEIGIASMRGGTIPGEHTVIFSAEDEVIELKHTAYSKKIFAYGAMDVCDWIVQQPAGFYDMADYINSKTEESDEKTI